ncbi:hypothetical protein [Prosthecodimorpha staleyi]|uniref:Uncharacterized protein n=1 Tax=Prosthecodimorpha staleyi TaxID=2840188 RepID=A0A947GAP4_9HYPH|nr:hypothetical protein [Prosthecodimorpha staleyi]MBT9289353.1 hypothetical protein [Prosthecodimorpha staleyi]
MKYLRNTPEIFFVVSAILATTETLPASAGQARLPEALTGLWASEAASCAKPDNDDRVEIARDRIEFFAASCRIDTLRQTKTGNYLMDETCEAEGEADAVAGRLIVKGRDRIEIRQGDTVHALLRCPKPAAAAKPNLQ